MARLNERNVFSGSSPAAPRCPMIRNGLSKAIEDYGDMLLAGHLQYPGSRDLAMSYQVLARRLRPAQFDELVGQDHVVRALVHGLENGRVHHAYLFTGTRGVGKTTIARILAKCLNCEVGVSATPCGECASCTEIAEGRHIDLLEVDAASRTKVDDTRDLLDNVPYLPTRGRYKIYLIDEVHMLSAASFNALLKTLEEPPEHVKFLLATTDPKKVPLTVLSRCLQLQLKNLLPEKIADYLREVLSGDDIVFDDAALTEIARAGRGSMRDALSITDQAIAYGGGAVHAGDVAAMLGGVEHAELERLLDAILGSDGAAVLAVCAELAARAVDFSEVLATVAATLHDAAVTQAVAEPGMEESPLARRVADVLSPEVVQLYYQIVVLGQRDLHLAPDPQCGFEMTMLRLLAFEPLQPDGDVRQPDGEGGRGRAVGSSQAGTESGSRSKGPSSRGPVSAARVEAEAGDVQQSESWSELVEALALSGVARMIAEHGIGRRIQDGTWRLVLDSDHDTLLNDAQVETIRRALSEHLGSSIELKVDVGDPGAETPARRRERIALERQQRAVAALQSDHNVQTLLEEFDGQLDLDSVRPRQ
jgi:DNA polymerase-3 subunit gamma/tau